MKKVMKRIVPLVLAVVMCVCMAAPAFAANATVPETMKSFPLQEKGDNNGYVGVIQQTLLYYNTTTYNAITSSGGCDWAFGSGTYTAVMSFQSGNGLVVDGVVGSKTWNVIANRFHPETMNNRTYEYYGWFQGDESFYRIIYVNNLTPTYVGSSNYAKTVTSSSIWKTYKPSGSLYQFRAE